MRSLVLLELKRLHGCNPGAVEGQRSFVTDFCLTNVLFAKVRVILATFLQSYYPVLIQAKRDVLNEK